MPRHFANFVNSARSARVLVVPQSLPVSRAADDLILIASATNPDEWMDRITFLPI